jgi:peptidoglycan/LPS O-acetylase OafA/YrhL
MKTSCPTFEDRLHATAGRPAGFDYLRITLAVGIIFFHSLDLVAGHNVARLAWGGVFRPADAIILPMFFALSGFLIAGSLQRSRTLISFLGLRAIRLLPALLVETMLCALVLGPLFTTFSPGRYFGDPGFRHYFLNILGDIHFKLPGVFLDNPFPGTVNGQLWTIPWEMKCYLVIAALALAGAARRPKLFVGVVCGLNLALLAYEIHTKPLHWALAHPVGSALVLSFLYGIGLYFFRARVVWHGFLCAGLLVLSVALLSMPLQPWGDILAPLPVAYVTVYLGLLEPRRLAVVASGDYSYGIYLYGFPVQQSLLALMGRDGLHWWVNFAMALPVAAAIAFCSWHGIEKQAARLRPYLFRFEAVVVTGARRLTGLRRAELADQPP